MVPKSYWPVCLDGIAKNYNLTAHSKTGISPHFAKYNEVELLDDLLTIGDIVVYFDNKPDKKKLSPKGRLGIFLSKNSPSCSSILIKENARYKLVKIHPHRVHPYRGKLEDLCWERKNIVEPFSNTIVLSAPIDRRNNNVQNSESEGRIQTSSPAREVFSTPIAHTPDRRSSGTVEEESQNSEEQENQPTPAPAPTENIVPPGKGVICQF